MKTSICLFLTIIIFATVSLAQKKTEKVEVGVQVTALTFFEPGFPEHQTKPGIGARVTYNFNDSIAAEAEINFFRQVSGILFAEGDAVQAQFGVKAGKRFEKFGIFAKVRPGFLSVDDVFSNQPEGFIAERKNIFTIDAGAVLEFYPSKRPVLRFEVGDTLIRHPAQFELVLFPPFEPPFPLRLVRPAKFNHNFQFSAGIGFRLGDFPSSENEVKTPSGSRPRAPRYEVGAQFTLLNLFPVTKACSSACLTSGFIPTHPGIGGRFTFNITDDVALEAEGNFFTRNVEGLPNPSGHTFQGQFGAKIGKRFEKWGAFGKVRPGFVGFSKVNQLISERPFESFLGPVLIGQFGVGKALYPSVDLGGVVEFYLSRRWVARFDVGDTIIRYSVLPVVQFSGRSPIFKRPPETQNNLQITSGVAFRF